MGLNRRIRQAESRARQRRLRSIADSVPKLADIKAKAYERGRGQRLYRAYLYYRDEFPDHGGWYESDLKTPAIREPEESWWDREEAETQAMYDANGEEWPGQRYGRGAWGP